MSERARFTRVLKLFSEKSFDTEEFFRAALTHSYGAGNAVPEVPKSGGPDTRNVGKTGR